MILFKLEKRNLLKLFSIIILLLIFIFSYSKGFKEDYKVKYKKYSGKATITVEETEDTIFIYYDMNLYWGLFTVHDKATILMNDYKPHYLFTDIKAVKKHSKGRTYFRDTLSVYYSKGDSTVVTGKYKVNDWVLLPIYFRYVEGDSLSVTLLQGDFTLHKTIKEDTVVWLSNNKEMIVKIVNTIPVYFNLQGNTFTKE